MAARLSLDARVFVESSLGGGPQRRGRSAAAGPWTPSTVHRELARCAGRAGYEARSAHASARCARARRERTPKLAVDPVLAAAVDECLRLRWSPHATAADLREGGHERVRGDDLSGVATRTTRAAACPPAPGRSCPRRARRRRPRSGRAGPKNPARWGNTGR